LLIYPNFWGAVFGVSALLIIYFVQKTRIKAGQGKIEVPPITVKTQ
jgi:hypothetical protein